MRRRGPASSAPRQRAGPGGRPPPQVLARVGGQLDQHRVVLGQVALQLLPDRPRRRRARPAGGHRDHQPAPPDHRGQDEVAARGLVGGVDPDAALPPLRRHRPADRRVIGRDERQPAPREVPRLVRRARCSIRPAATQPAKRGVTVGLTTVTCAPAASRPSTFPSATGPPPPTTSTAPSVRSRNTG